MSTKTAYTSFHMSTSSFPQKPYKHITTIVYVVKKYLRGKKYSEDFEEKINSFYYRFDYRLKSFDVCNFAYDQCEEH